MTQGDPSLIIIPTAHEKGADRMNYRLALSAAIFVLIAIAVACGDDDEAAPTLSPTITDTPIVTPSPESSPLASECPTPSGDAPTPADLSYSEPPALTIDTSKIYFADINTVRGAFTIKLLPDVAPQHVNSFVFLAREGYFDGITFHRVVPGFVAQAGDPTGTGSGGPGYTLDAEFSDIPYTRGVVGMARRSEINSAGSQWFVTYEEAANLNGLYTVFGEVTEGMDVVDCVTPRNPADPNAPPGDAITSIDIREE
jgi:peptidylprolyl isomerase